MRTHLNNGHTESKYILSSLAALSFSQCKIVLHSHSILCFDIAKLMPKLERCVTFNHGFSSAPRNIGTYITCFRYTLNGWWVESQLSGIPRLLMGLRDHQGVVHKLQMLHTADFPNEAQVSLFVFFSCISFHCYGRLLQYRNNPGERSPLCYARAIPR